MYISPESSPLSENNQPMPKKVEELSLLDKLSRAQELISDTISKKGEDEQTRNSRIEDAKHAFLIEVSDVAELADKLNAIGEKEVAEKLKNIFNL